MIPPLPNLPPGQGIKLIGYNDAWTRSVKAAVLEDNRDIIFTSYREMHQWLGENSIIPNPLAYLKVSVVPLPRDFISLNPVLFASGDKNGSYEWATPDDLFQKCAAEVQGYDLDLAASFLNTKCPRYIGPTQFIYQEYMRLCELEKSEDKLVRAQHAGASTDFLERMGCNTLTKPWHQMGEKGWLNPKYGRQVKQFVKKSWEECSKGFFVTLLLPARTDTEWFHSWIYPAYLGKDGYCSATIEFIEGRVSYLLDGEELDPAPFPSMIVHMANVGNKTLERLE